MIDPLQYVANGMEAIKIWWLTNEAILKLVPYKIDAPNELIFNFQDDLVDLNSSINQPDVTPIQFLSNQGINRLNLPFQQNFPSNQVRFINAVSRRCLAVPTLLKIFQGKFFLLLFCFNFYF